MHSIAVPPAVATDAALMRCGGEAAFAEVVRRHGPAVERVARAVAGDGAEDVAQQAFLAAWLARAQFDPQRGELGTWLCGIARNRGIDALRSSRRHAVLRPLDSADQIACPAEGPADAASRRAQAAEIRQALRRIPSAQRTALTLAYYGGMTQSEIQGKTGNPLGTVKSRLRLGLNALRTELTEAA